MRILRLPDVKARVGLSRSSIYKLINEEKFPKPVSLGKRSVGWVEQDIDEWIETLINPPQIESNVVHLDQKGSEAVQ